MNTDNKLSRKAHFPRTLISLTADFRLSVEEITIALLRHYDGDWGDLDTGEQTIDYASNADGDLVSRFQSESGEEFWVITQADHSVTTVLMSEDF